MASSFAISRAHLVYGVCLPLAVLIGYFLAEPLESGSVAVVVLVLTVLSLPMLMRWHHVLLIGGWNSFCLLFFLPGAPTLWLLLAFISFFLSLLGRSVGQKRGFFAAPGVAWSLILLAAVVVATAEFSGGVGMRSLGGSIYGGRKYIYLLGGIVCFFALAGQRLDTRKALSYLALFFLSGLCVAIGYLAMAGGGMDFLARMFPVEPELAGDRAFGNDFLVPTEGLFRLASIGPAAGGTFNFLLARYGIRGLFDFSRPWRMLALFLALVGALACGFRGLLITIILTFCFVFVSEGLFRPRYIFLVLFLGMLGTAVLLPTVHLMPLSMQRTLSFLPLNVDSVVRNSSDASVEWRIQMWQEALPLVPKYLFKGKGYALDPSDLSAASLSAYSGAGLAAEGALAAGDYHNGPLSIIIPFGVYGVVAFLWFICASLRVLHRNYRYGDPSLKTINTLLLAAFIVRTIGFIFIFGSISSDLVGFTGLVGFSVSMNGVAGPVAVRVGGVEADEVEE